MMFLLGLLLSFTESDGKGMTGAERQLAHCFPVALFLRCHDAKIPPIRSYRHLFKPFLTSLLSRARANTLPQGHSASQRKWSCDL